MRMQKINFRTKEMAERFMENYGEEIFFKRGYSPVRAYYDEDDQAWQVTSSYLNATNVYLGELKERGVLRIPHNCTKLHKDKLVLKQLLFDMDSVVVDIISCIANGMAFPEQEHRLDFLMSIARKMMGEDSHKNRVAKFQIYLKDGCYDEGRLAVFEGYFQKKIQHYNLSSCKISDEVVMNAKRACSRFFCLVDGIKKEIESGKTDAVADLVERAESLWNEFKDINALSYKRKQAECDLLYCKQAC